MKLVISFFLAVSVESGGVPRAGLASLIYAGNLPLKVLDLVVLFFYKCHEALVARGERGVV